MSFRKWQKLSERITAKVAPETTGDDVALEAAKVAAMPVAAIAGAGPATVSFALKLGFRSCL